MKLHVGEYAVRGGARRQIGRREGLRLHCDGETEETGGKISQEAPPRSQDTAKEVEGKKLTRYHEASYDLTDIGRIDSSARETTVGKTSIRQDLGKGTATRFRGKSIVFWELKVSKPLLRGSADETSQLPGSVAKRGHDWRLWGGDRGM